MNTLDLFGARAASMEAGKVVHGTWDKHMSEADIFELVQSFQAGLEEANEKHTVTGVQEQVQQNIPDFASRYDSGADDLEGNVFDQNWFQDPEPSSSTGNFDAMRMDVVRYMAADALQAIAPDSAPGDSPRHPSPPAQRMRRMSADGPY